MKGDVNRTRKGPCLVSKVVVIGGGVVGLSCAYYLLKDGHEVTVLDRDGATKGTSWGNAGMIVPSHFEPMANPAMLALGMKMAGEKGSPLGFALRGEVAKWSLAFSRAATRKHVLRTQNTILNLNRHSRECYLDIYREGVTLGGLLMVCANESTLHAEGEKFAACVKLDVKVEVLGSADLRIMGFRGAGAVWFHEDAWVTPYDFMAWLRNEVLRLGGDIQATTVESLIKEGSKIRAVRANSGEFEADEFVLAAGAWSGKVARKFLMMPGRGYGFTVENPPKRTSISAILVEARIATTPVSNGQRFTGVMEVGAWGNDVSRARLDRIRASIPDYVPEFADHDFKEEVWVGHRPCSFDGVPFIGRFKKHSNLIAATGHGMMGMSLGPGTGKLVSQIVAGTQTDVDLTICDPDR